MFVEQNGTLLQRGPRDSIEEKKGIGQEKGKNTGSMEGRVWERWSKRWMRNTERTEGEGRQSTRKGSR